MPLDCTPGTNLALYKCLSCLTVDELLKIWLVVLADSPNSGYTLPNDAATLLQDAACWACLSDKQLLQAAISANAQDVLSSEMTVNEIRDRIRCLLCASPKAIKAMLAMLICRMGFRQLPSPPAILSITFGGVYPNATYSGSIDWTVAAYTEHQMQLFIGGIWVEYTEGQIVGAGWVAAGLDATAVPGTPYRVRTTGDGVQYSGYSPWFTGNIP